MRHGSRIAAEDDSVAEALGQLRDELAVVRQVLDEIRSELQWANRNRGDSYGAAAHVDGNASLTHGPAVVEWSARRVPGSS
ncbi:MAG: hypothetical protein GXY83_20905 [Rhodopirellula sp.]|nr:hypothetical protein [Rhodopirellula sp.]